MAATIDYYPYPGRALVCVKVGSWKTDSGISPKVFPLKDEIVRVKRSYYDNGVYLVLEGFDDPAAAAHGLPYGFNALSFKPLEQLQDEYSAEILNRALSPEPEKQSHA